MVGRGYVRWHPCRQSQTACSPSGLTSRIQPCWTPDPFILDYTKISSGNPKIWRQKQIRPFLNFIDKKRNEIKLVFLFSLIIGRNQQGRWVSHGWTCFLANYFSKPIDIKHVVIEHLSTTTPFFTVYQSDYQCIYHN